MRYVLLIGMLVATPVWASSPGDALDCTDWIFNEPGLTCSFVVPRPCDSSLFCGDVADGVDPRLDNYGVHQAVTPSGRLIMVRGVDSGETCLRVSTVAVMRRFEIVALDGGQETILGSISERCVTGVPYNRIDSVGQFPPSGIANSSTIYPGVTNFDPQAGRLLLRMQTSCFGVGGNCPADYGTGVFVFGIGGFTTTFEILQSFTPTADAFGFRVPYMPEGMQYADFFDTYTGDLATVGDWTQLQPLQCSYPATAPSVGDYFEVTDTLPDPAPGTGRYYLTVANYMGERRFGRKNIGGTLSGRDPTALPTCP